MTIEITDAMLAAIGFSGRFDLLPYYERKRVASLALDAAGRRREAFLLEINNPNAVSAVVYRPGPVFRRSMPGAVGRAR